MYYSDELIEEIRERNDIVDVISGYVKLKKQGSSHFGLCPFHNEKSPSFSVSQGKQMFYCFGCGAGGNVISFIMKYESSSFLEAVRFLADRAGISLPETEMNEEEKRAKDKKSRILQINKEAARFFYYQLKSEKGSAAYHYLRGRELSDDTILTFGLGYAGKGGQILYRYLREKQYSDDLLKESGLFTFSEKGVTDKFWNRVMYPIMDVNNRVIGFGGRVMGDGQPKYLNSPETIVFDKSRNLYGLNIARSDRRPYLILCEGYMDVISMHQAGFSNAVASLGTSLTSGQASLIKRYTKEVILSYDSDGAGIKAALRAIPILKEAGLRVRVNNMSPYKDPDEFIKALGADSFQERLNHAENSFIYEIRIMQREFDMTDPAGKTSFYQAVSRKLVEDFAEELERNNYLEAVSAEFGIPFDSLKSSVNQRLLTYSGKKDYERPILGQEVRRKKTEDGSIRAQKLLLTWMTEEPELYDKVRAYLTPADFSRPLYQTAAAMLFEQFAAGEVKPAQIVSRFEDEEEQKEIAALFQTNLKQEVTGKDREKAFNDILYKVKKTSIEEHLRTERDPEVFQKLMMDQIGLQKMHISFH